MLNRRQFTAYALTAPVIAGFSLPGVAAPAAIARRTIGAGKETLPVVGLGNSPAFTADDQTVAARLIDIFLQHGGGYIDLDGRSRFKVGRIARLSGAADKLFLGNYFDAANLAEARTFAGRLAEAQGKPGLDLVNSRDLANFRTQAANYAALKEAGLTRYTGVARFGPQAIEPMIGLIEDGLVDFIQINYSLLEPQAADRLLPLAQDRGVAVIINRPFINGRYFDLVREQPLPQWAAEFDCNSWAQFSLKYIIAHPAVTSVLTETSKPHHATDNLGAGFGRLPDAAMRERMLRYIRELS